MSPRAREPLGSKIITRHESQLRANRVWRERTGLQLVQAWLPKSVVDHLDQIVKSTGARGRSAALIRLIEGASASRVPGGGTQSP